MSPRDELSVELCALPPSTSWPSAILWWIGLAVCSYYALILIIKLLLRVFGKPILSAARQISDVTVSLRVEEQNDEVGARIVYLFVFQPNEDNKAVLLYDLLPGKKIVSATSQQEIDRDTPLHKLRFEPMRALSL